MFKNSSARWYQNNKERLQKKLPEGIKIFLKKKKEKSGDMVVSDANIYQKMNVVYRCLLSIENKKLVQNRKKYYKIRKNLLLLL